MEVHAAEVKKVPGFKKYVFNRVTNVLAGDIKFWGLAEFWWDSEEAMRQVSNNPDSKRYNDDFRPRIVERFQAIVEEKEIKS